MQSQSQLKYVIFNLNLSMNILNSNVISSQICTLGPDLNM